MGEVRRRHIYAAQVTSACSRQRSAAVGERQAAGTVQYSVRRPAQRPRRRPGSSVGRLRDLCAQSAARKYSVSDNSFYLLPLHASIKSDSRLSEQTSHQ